MNNSSEVVEYRINANHELVAYLKTIDGIVAINLSDNKGDDKPGETRSAIENLPTNGIQSTVIDRTNV